MRTLHVAALPFPSFQGTQALLHTMLCALQEAGHETHLVCYAHGAGPLQRALYTVHRAHAPVQAHSLRSGPSGEKLLLDAGLLRALPSLERKVAPEIVFAHHVEAAACALATARAPVVYVAHTSLESELPSYFSRSFAPFLRVAGTLLDRTLCLRAARTLAVSPLLSRMLSARAHAPVHPLTSPWVVPPPITTSERREARSLLGLGEDALVFLYAGNLDRYQGLEQLVLGLARLRERARPFSWLIATESNPRELRAQLAAHGLVAHTRFVPLAGEAARRAAHAASDVALVPRASPGGVPVKLLDALSRGLPVVATRRACAGLRLDDVCELVLDDSPAAWCEVLCSFADLPAARKRVRGALGAPYVRRAHAPSAFVEELLCHARVLVQAARS